MESKYSFKAIQNGQTKLARVVRTGAGFNGQALVVHAEDGVRYQLINLVTLSSAAKLQMKKKGDDLWVALPEGDADMPDIVIKGYFAVTGGQFQGLSQGGEWMVYDTTALMPQSDFLYKEKSLLDQDAASAVALANPPLALMTQFDGPWGLAGLGAGALTLSSSSDGSSGGGIDNVYEPFSQYAQADSTSSKVTAPTKANYVAAGVVLPVVEGVTEANVIDALNRVVNQNSSANVSSKAQLQQLANDLKTSYRLILDKANGSLADDSSLPMPTVKDYAHVGVTVGSTGKTLALMNSVLSESNPTAVDSPAKLSAMAQAADHLMQVAAGEPDISVSAADLLALGLKINGNNSGITSVQSAAFAKNLSSLLTGLGETDSLKTGEAVDTQAEVQALFSLQVMRSFNDDVAALGSKTQPAPGLSDYTHVGIKAFKSLTDTSDASRVSLDTLTFAAGVNWQTTLNSALDKQLTGTGLTKASVQTMVDAYYKVLRKAASTKTDSGNYVNDASNNPLAADYTAIGVTQSDDKKSALGAGKTLNLLNDAVGRLAATSVDTVVELQALEKAAENLMALGAGAGDGSTTTGITYTDDNNHSDWLNGLSLLGVQGVTANNWTGNGGGVRKAIDMADSANDGQAIDTVQELQAIVSLYRVNDYADNESLNPVPTLVDYQALLIKASGKLTDVMTNDANYLAAYNDAVKSKPNGSAHDTFTEAQIKNMVLSFNTILNEADGDKSQDLTALDPGKSDYENVGLGNGSIFKTNLDAMLNNAGSVSLLTDVIGGKTKDQVNSTKELNDLGLIVSRIQELVDKNPTSNLVAQKNDTIYDSITNGRLTVKDFQDLGLDVANFTSVSGDVLTHRVNAVMDSIFSLSTMADLDSLSKLQKYITNTSGINS